MKLRKLFHALTMLLVALALLGARPAAANPGAIPGSNPAADPGASPEDLEALRSRLLDYVGELRRLPAPVQARLSPTGPLALDEAERQLRELPAGELRVLQKALGNVPYWTALPRLLASAPAPASASASASAPVAAPPAGAKAFGCGGSFPNKQVCETKAVLQQLKGLPATVQSYAEQAYDDLSGELTSLFSTLAGPLSWISDPQPQDLLAALDSVGGPDLTSSGWWLETAQKIPPVDLPCPSQGIPSIGAMGDLRATYECKQGLEWITRGIHDLAPDDIWGVNVKLVTGTLYYPVNYLCLCYEQASSLAEDRADGAHDDLQRARLDTAVSTRASQTNVNGAAAQVSDLDGDVAAVEAKLDALEGRADDLAEQQTGTSSFLLEFQDLVLRLRIEADLYREGNDRISLFQLPKDVGGFLDMVRGIVAAAIKTREGAGADVRQALAELGKGDQEQARKAYKSAYTSYRKAYRAAVGSL